MRLIKNKDGVSELVGAMMILLILILYLGILQAYEVPKWNKELEKQNFDQVSSDFIVFRSDIEDVSTRNIPKTSSLHMGTKYPERFMLRNPGTGAYGIITSYPLNINLSYVGTGGSLKWKNFTSTGIVYEMKGISDFPKLVYENGLLIMDYGDSNISIDDRQSLITEDNIFIPVIEGKIDSFSSIDAKIFDFQPASQAGQSHARFSTANVTIQTRYPNIWKELADKSGTSEYDITVGTGNQCPSGISGCIKITNISGYSLRRLIIPGSDTGQSSSGQINAGMISIDNSMMNSRGATGPDGQDMWERGQGRLDIPASSTATQFIIQDITMGRAMSHHHDEGEEEETTNKLKFSVTDNNDHLWTIEIKLRKKINGELWVDYVKQKYPAHVYNTSLNIYDGKYNSFSYTNITLSREIDLTTYYKQLSNINVPNILTIDQMDPQILYVNFVIN